jgi:hypothetical protein
LQVFGLDVSVVAFCILHAKMRIVEKFLKLLVNFQIPQVILRDEKYVKDWETRISKLPHLSNFKIWQPKDKTSLKWKCSSLTGPQASSILENHREISEKWENSIIEWTAMLQNQQR